MQRWERGTQITWRYGDGPAEPMTVVQDDEQALVAWQSTGLLRIAPTNAWWSVGVRFDTTTHEHLGWVVSVEDPLTRADHEVHTRDHLLDIAVEPDRTHRRTGEAELATAVQQGRYNRDEAELITSVAEQAEAAIEAWGSPFCDGWERWTPDPT